jgi:hypothetical protein
MSVPFLVDVDQGTRRVLGGRCPGWMRAVRSRAMVSRSEAATRTNREEWLLIGLMAAIWVLMLSWTPGITLHEDTRRFMEISSAPGTPYRDFTVEYPPFETLLILFLGRGSEVAVVWKLAIINGASTLGCWILLRRFWSRRVSTLFLWFALPIQFFMAFRLDALSVLMMLGAIVLADRRRTTSGGILAAAGVMFRVWPIVVIPVFLIRRRARAFVIAALVTLLAGVCWVAISGTGAVSQVSGYRGATGWHVESGPGVLDQVLHPDAQVHLEEGALRVGSMLPWEVRSLRLVTLVLVASAWLLGSRRTVDPSGGPALAAVSVLLVLSPLFSPQYLVWLLPWAAVTASERRVRDVQILTIGAGVFASLAIAIYIWSRYANVLEIVSLGRIICVVGLAVIGFTHARIATEPSDRLLEAA